MRVAVPEATPSSMIMVLSGAVSQCEYADWYGMGLTHSPSHRAAVASTGGGEGDKRRGTDGTAQTTTGG